MGEIGPLIAAYGKLSVLDRLHIVGRWVLCPMRAIADHLPRHGLILDLGCGHGLFAQLLARGSAARTVIGFDIDPYKVAIARRLRLPNLEFQHGDLAKVALPAAQAVTIIDVLYLIPYDAQVRLLRMCAARLVPGGVLVIKEMADRPRWKAWLNRLEETLAVNVLRITHGTALHFRPTVQWEAVLRASGLMVETVLLDRAYYHPHVLFVARKGDRWTPDWL